MLVTFDAGDEHEVIGRIASVSLHKPDTVIEMTAAELMRLLQAYEVKVTCAILSRASTAKKGGK